MVDPRLTEDELTIIFDSREPIVGGVGGRDLYIATRSGIGSVFDNIRNLTEINSTSDDVLPLISPDGLTLYFNSNRDGQLELYKAVRVSLTEPVGNIELITTFYAPESAAYSVTLSNDGNTCYFYGSPTEGAPSNIYVSYWGPHTYHVDGTTGSDVTGDGLSYETAFATIQAGIDAAADSDTVAVWPGVYEVGLAVDFDGKAITVRSADEPAVVRNLSGYAFDFHNVEGAGSVLSNFILSGGMYGVQVNIGCSPVIRNLTIADNEFGIVSYEGADPDIVNCIVYDNLYGDMQDCTADHSWVEDDIRSGMVGYWKFDEGIGGTAYDSIGGNDGTLVGVPAWTTGGKVDDALDFDGDDGVYIESSG